jgi:hypothetical protein
VTKFLASRQFRSFGQRIVDMNAPKKTVVEAFNATENPEVLEGGQGEAWRSGEVVLKPEDNPGSWERRAKMVSSIVPDGFRLAVPIRANDGRWVVDGWCAQQAVAGVHEPRVPQRYNAALR